ncbi:MAG: hypothetical protein V2J65_24095 [Desulfobacteraceae bacterium]|nr:hypothetical protein [Desulfobacteraceae bacterium]
MSKQDHPSSILLMPLAGIEPAAGGLGIPGSLAARLSPNHRECPPAILGGSQGILPHPSHTLSPPEENHRDGDTPSLPEMQELYVDPPEKEPSPPWPGSAQMPGSRQRQAGRKTRAIDTLSETQKVEAILRAGSWGED